MKKIFILIVIILSLLLTLFFYSGLSSPPSLPPGCINTGTSLGGCYSNQSLRILGKLNFVPCLSIKVNNCSQPRLEIRSSCDSPITINGVETDSKSSYTYLDAKQGLNLFRGSGKDLPFVIFVFVSPPLCN